VCSGLQKIFVRLFGVCALVNTIIGIQFLLYCTHPQKYVGINIAQYMVSPRPPCVAIQHTIFAMAISCKGQGVLLFLWPLCVCVSVVCIVDLRSSMHASVRSVDMNKGTGC